MENQGLLSVKRSVGFVVGAGEAQTEVAMFLAQPESCSLLGCLLSNFQALRSRRCHPLLCYAVRVQSSLSRRHAPSPNNIHAQLLHLLRGRVAQSPVKLIINTTITTITMITSIVTILIVTTIRYIHLLQRCCYHPQLPKLL